MPAIHSKITRHIHSSEIFFNIRIMVRKKEVNIRRNLLKMCQVVVSGDGKWSGNLLRAAIFL